MKPTLYPYQPVTINADDRKAALLDMGVSPGEDEDYYTQAKRLRAQKDQFLDNRKLGILQQIESAIQSNRILDPLEGGLNPVDFIKETLAKSIPAPSELNPANIVKGAVGLAKGAGEVAKHPLASAKQALLNPPDATTLASLALPGAALKAYRELVPLSARVYLHHMAGVPTPFNQVTEAERTALAQMAQEKIDGLLETQNNLDRVKAHALQNINDIKLMSANEVKDYIENDSTIPRSIIYNKDGSFKNLPEVKDGLIKHYKDERPSIFAEPTTLKSRGYLGSEADNTNVREDYQNITGKKLPGFQIFPDEYANTFGKTYIEPMIDKTTGQIVPKSIKDTYKFYPDVYGYSKGEGLERLKQELYLLRKGYSFNSTIKNIFNTRSDMSLGILARKLGMRRPTSIIDIPLQALAPLNAYDKAAILLGTRLLARKED